MFLQTQLYLSIDGVEIEFDSFIEWNSFRFRSANNSSETNDHSSDSYLFSFFVVFCFGILFLVSYQINQNST